MNTSTGSLYILSHYPNLAKFCDCKIVKFEWVFKQKCKMFLVLNKWNCSLTYSNIRHNRESKYSNMKVYPCFHLRNRNKVLDYLFSFFLLKRFVSWNLQYVRLNFFIILKWSLEMYVLKQTENIQYSTFKFVFTSQHILGHTTAKNLKGLMY